MCPQRPCFLPEVMGFPELQALRGGKNDASKAQFQGPRPTGPTRQPDSVCPLYVCDLPLSP